MKHGIGMPLRRVYMGRFVGRCATLFIAIWLYLFGQEQFAVLPGMAFFERLSLLHILWGIWITDMLMQLIPLRQLVPLGSQKLFSMHFRPRQRAQDTQLLAAYSREQNRRAFWIFVTWALLIAGIGVLYSKKIIQAGTLLLISVVFYVCDLICVLFWCPFRVFFLQNRCCTTCRIFNWDHLMMFTPMIYLKSFYAWSLLALAIVVFLVWEVKVHRHPERFWEGTNQALLCKECTDRLCFGCDKRKKG